jgi:hypothetical protein
MRMFLSALLAVFALSASAETIFQQQARPSIGYSRDVATPQPTQSQQEGLSCAQLSNERRAIDEITEKQIWVPIEQQNANYHRMNWLKGQMAARGCSYRY